MQADVQLFHFGASGEIPNNSLPLLFLRHALPPDLTNPGGCQSLFARNNWGGNWVDGIFDYWHFHVSGHEALGCVAGSARVGFGGDAGVQVEVEAGDVVIIPAGVGHKRLSERRDGFTIVGGYPPHQNGTIIKPGDISLDEAQRQIASLALPRSDPVSGSEGPLIEAWRLR